MPSVPHKIYVGNFTYRVERPEHVVVSYSTNHWGSQDIEDQVIEVQKDLPSKSREAETLLHEIFHALWNNEHLHKQTWYNTSIEEIVVSSLSSALLELLVDNPELMKYLTKVTKEIRSNHGKS